MACGHDTKHDHEHANDFMHQSSVEELIERFESPERDAYQKPEKVLKYLGNIDGKTVMDIGAGSGYFSVKLAEKGAQVIAADVNDEFLAHVRKRVEENAIENIEVRKIEYDNPLLESKETDLVLLVNTYHHINKRPTYFGEVKQGIKDNGSLVIIDFFKSETPVGPPTNHKVSIDQIIAELKTVGFQHFEVEVNLLPYQFIIQAR